MQNHIHIDEKHLTIVKICVYVRSRFRFFRRFRAGGDECVCSMKKAEKLIVSSSRRVKVRLDDYLEINRRRLLCLLHSSATKHSNYRMCVEEFSIDKRPLDDPETDNIPDNIERGTNPWLSDVLCKQRNLLFYRKKISALARDWISSQLFEMGLESAAGNDWYLNNICMPNWIRKFSLLKWSWFIDKHSTTPGN